MLQSGSWHAEFGSGAGGSVHSSSAFAQRSLNDRLLLRRKLPKRFKSTARHSNGRLPGKPTFIDGESLCFTYNDGSLNHVLQFANITRPRVRLKQIEALFVHRLKALSCFPRVTINEVLDQQGDIFSSLPERGNLNWKNVEPVKEVAPEHTRSDGSLQIAVSSSNHSNIRSDRSSSTDTIEFMFLQNTQESDLCLGRKLPDFIEEDRASFGQLKAP